VDSELRFYNQTFHLFAQIQAAIEMTNTSDISDRYERALKKTEQLATVMAILSVITLFLLFA